MKSFKILVMLTLLSNYVCSQVNTSNNIDISGAGSIVVNGEFTAISKNESGYDIYANPVPITASSIYLYRYNDTHWVIGSTSGEEPSGSGVYFYIENNAVSPAGLLFTETGTLGTEPCPTTSDPALPVELTTFHADVNEKMVILLWETATEVNNYGFEVERQYQISRGQYQEWEKVGFIEGHGNSNSPKHYTFEDNSEKVSGKYFYRLKQIDIDGKFEYSDVIEISISAPNEFSLAQNYPNPFNPVTTIEYSILNQHLDLPGVQGSFSQRNVILKIYDILGKEMATLVNEPQSSGNYSVRFDASKYPSGLYFYTIASGQFKQSRKMILIK